MTLLLIILLLIDLGLAFYVYRLYHPKVDLDKPTISPEEYARNTMDDHLRTYHRR